MIFIFVLLVLVLAHEAGHFFAARAFGIKVEEFGLGIPPRILKLWRDKHGTLFSLNLLPLGGFVRIKGEEGEGDGDAESFGSKPASVRALVLLSGVLANLLLAYILFVLVSGLGIMEVVSEEEAAFYPDAEITILAVATNSPAEQAGIRIGDKVSGFKTIEELQKFLKDNSGKEVVLNVFRGRKELAVEAAPRKTPPEGEGPLGIALGWTRIKKTPWAFAPLEGARMTLRALWGTLAGFYGLAKDLLLQKSPEVDVAGPVGIFNITASAAAAGWGFLMVFLSFLSINLAVINVIPFPGLDGGRLFFIFLEVVRQRRISPKTSALAHSLGLMILIALMLAITYRDLAKIY